MVRIPDELITKTGVNTVSFYDFLISRYVAPHLTIFLKIAGIKSPNLVTLLSFIFILLPGFMVLNISGLKDIYYRAIIAILIQLSFVLDCSDGQLARIIGKTSKLGAWLDKVFDRVGEFFIFTIFGIAGWWQTGNLIFLFLGIVTGYALSVFTLAMALSDSEKLMNLKKVLMAREAKTKKEEDVTENQSRGFRDTRFAFILTRVFFFLNFGIGERYLYLSCFILLNRVDILLFISSFLSILRFISISYYVGTKLRQTDALFLKARNN
ncbi:MAG: CDP-alcohol phosphatidyltransferase family protein [Thermodesulfovibrionales bacterium]